MRIIKKDFSLPNFRAKFSDSKNFLKINRKYKFWNNWKEYKKEDKCEKCGCELHIWYVVLIKVLKKKGLLDDDFEMLCCSCYNAGKNQMRDD